MTETKPRYKLILHMSDSSSLIETLSEVEKNLLEKELAACNAIHLRLKLPSGKNIFVSHIMSYEIVDFQNLPIQTQPEEEIVVSSYVGSN